MKTSLACIPCIITQCLTTLNLTRVDEEKKKSAVNKLLEKLKTIDYDLPPSYNSDIAYAVAYEFTGVKDPYLKLKKECNKLALEIYPKLKEMVEHSKDRMYTAIKVAIEGNIIDFGININKGKPLDFQKILRDIKEMPFAIDDYKEFEKSLDSSTNIFYVGDNAGEIVFDRVLIEELIRCGKKVVLSVKSGPVINDATLEDVREAGLTDIVKVIETGNSSIGVNFRSISQKFVDEFKKADLIIAKGQGNFETLDNIEANTFFMLKAKCETIANKLGVEYLDVVLVKRRHEWGSKKI
ncbi:MAG: DUF89 family protein [Actinobacteria bacterium]|nr:DUF89 family protein [Actinomycetota bacterium]